MARKTSKDVDAVVAAAMAKGNAAPAGSSWNARYLEASEESMCLAEPHGRAFVSKVRRAMSKAIAQAGW